MPVFYYYSNIRGMFGFTIRGEISTLATSPILTSLPVMSIAVCESPISPTTS